MPIGASPGEYQTNYLTLRVLDHAVARIVRQSMPFSNEKKTKIFPGRGLIPSQKNFEFFPDLFSTQT